jgi:hypothetical protein
MPDAIVDPNPRPLGKSSGGIAQSAEKQKSGLRFEGHS